MFWQIFLITSLAMPTQVTSRQENAKVSSLSKCLCIYWECGGNDPWHFPRKCFYFQWGFAKCTFPCEHYRSPLWSGRVKSFTKWLKIVKLLLSQQSAGWVIFWAFGKHVTTWSVINLPSDHSEQHALRSPRWPCPPMRSRKAGAHGPPRHTLPRCFYLHPSFLQSSLTSQFQKEKKKPLE